MPRKKFSKRKKVVSNISRLLFYIIIPLIFISLLYLSTLFILNMRNGGDYDSEEVLYVIGIEDLPTYPGSRFIFENNMEDASVANFIGSGNSAYRLPLNKTVSQAYEYYKEILPELGWQNVLSVEVGSDEMKDGEYWAKGGAGLRIYSKFNDLWYESITVEQANNGLKERVQREAERDLLLASQELQELLPDFPWVVKIPKEYVISYSTSNYDDLRLVKFKKIGTNESVTVTPVGAIGGPLDNHLQEYLETLEEEEAATAIEAEGVEQGQGWGITNTIIKHTSYATALEGTISSNGEVHEVAVVPNSYNNTVYVIHSNGLENPFFEYVLSNMEPQGINKD